MKPLVDAPPILSFKQYLLTVSLLLWIFKQALMAGSASVFHAGSYSTSCMDTLALAFLMTLFPLMAILKTFLVHRAYNLLTTKVSINQIFPSGFGNPLDGWQTTFCLPQHGYRQHGYRQHGYSMATAWLQHGCSMAKSMASSIANSNFMAKHPLQRNQIIAHKKVIGQVTRRVIVTE